MIKHETIVKILWHMGGTSTTRARPLLSSAHKSVCTQTCK